MDYQKKRVKGENPPMNQLTNPYTISKEAITLSPSCFAIMIPPQSAIIDAITVPGELTSAYLIIRKNNLFTGSKARWITISTPGMAWPPIGKYIKSLSNGLGIYCIFDRGDFLT